jgi:hypothetical protein
MDNPTPGHPRQRRRPTIDRQFWAASTKMTAPMQARHRELLDADAGCRSHRHGLATALGPEDWQSIGSADIGQGGG